MTSTVSTPSTALRTSGKIAKATATLVSGLMAITAIGFGLSGLANEHRTMWWITIFGCALMLAIIAFGVDQIGTYLNSGDPDNGFYSTIMLALCWVACVVPLAGAVLVYRDFIIGLIAVVISAASGIGIFQGFLVDGEPSTTA